jgi:hypothetical protein
MNKACHLLLVVLLLAGTCLSQQRIIRRTSVRNHPYYRANVLPALKELVAHRGKARRNHFYVGRVEALENGYDSALVFWKENGAIVLWEPGRGSNRHGNPDGRYDLRYSRRYWRLNKDVVPTLNDVGGSSFLITRQDARNWVRDCIRYGTRYVVTR